MANKIGCRSGRTKLIDPNSFDGQDSSSNMSVPLEDLNIYVQLDTFKKGRTVLIAGSDNESRSESSKTLSVRFIEGTTINGQKVLTTKYTDLTTSFDRGQQENNEALGITNIEVDFNSSYAPLITINFVDIRGSAIFQNEQELDGSNKYSTFFQLPYPLYQLTIKGYYGKPVKYCLHMTKFSSRFNSQTGNFEITASFIGFTYALLSDMLAGYLKAIPNTKIGEDVYNLILGPAVPNTVRTLHELIYIISNISSQIKKVAANDNDAKLIDDIKIREGYLEKIFQNVVLLAKTVDTFKRDVDISDNKNLFRYFITDNNPATIEEPKARERQFSSKQAEESNKKFASAGTTNVQNYRQDTGVAYNATAASDLISVKNEVDKYVTNVNAIIKDFNDDNFQYQLLESDFTSFAKNVYQGFQKVLLANPPIDPDKTDADLKKVLNNPDDKTFEIKKNELSEIMYSGDYKTLLIEKLVDVYDMSKSIDKLNEMTKTLKDASNDATKKLALSVKFRLEESLGFDPNIRNIFTIFTTAVEALLLTIYKVSVAAEGNSERQKILANIFKDSTSELNSGKIYAWPDFVDKDYKEKYLGSANGLTETDKSHIDELQFIDNLLDAFIKEQQQTQSEQATIAEVELNWTPINPLDTPLFVQTSPYKRLKTNNYFDVIVLMLIRATTFLGYSNKNLTDDEIKIMAISEGNLVNELQDTIIKQAIGNNSPDFLEVVPGKIDDVSKSVVVNFGANMIYNYITAIDNSQYLPVSNRFTNATWLTSDVDLIERGDSDTFLSNYSSARNVSKPVDGATYVKIMSVNEYEAQKRPLKEQEIISAYNDKVKINKTKNQLSLMKIAHPTSNIADNLNAAGFNTFGGIYGIEEFVDMDFNDKDKLTGLELKYVFYDDQLFNGLGFSRNVSGDDDGPVVPTGFEYPRYKGVLSSSPVQVINNTFRLDLSDAPKLHRAFGKNRGLLNFIHKSYDNITYPFVTMVSNVIIDSNIIASDGFSLFGSLWYYAQLSDYAKALLFLSTIPFNGFSFDKPEVLRLFDQKSGFIHAPRLWCAYIGGLMWRADTANPIYEGNKQVGGGSGLQDPVIYMSGGTIIAPLYSSAFQIPNKSSVINILDYDSSQSINVPSHELLTALPDQARNEFKRIFFEFVNGDANSFTTWKDIASVTEIWGGTPQDFANKLDGLYAIATLNTDKDGKSSILKSDLDTGFIHQDYYKTIALDLRNQNSFKTSALRYTLQLELDGDYNSFISGTTLHHAPKTLIQAMTEEVVITNANFRIFEDGNGQTSARQSINVKKDNLDLYLKTILEILSKSTTNPVKERKQLEQEVFGTDNEDAIKLQLYRTCKNIYDKWLGGVTIEDDVMFQCGNQQKRREKDSALATALRPNNDKPRLIDSFRFVSRSFADIGDVFYINPLPIVSILKNNPNASFYDIVSNILSDNNFNFVALPSYIDYTDDSELSALFEPFDKWEKVLDEGICGPSFVCVYAGQTSKNLDFDNSKSYQYKNDGFDVKCLDGSITNLPEDFKSPLKDYEDAVSVFAVNYSQQNQNIFKDITLDQNEFTETAQSLQVIDNIASKGAENNRTLAGQNIYNVYSVRSYKAEVEMMGNAMIQPMMYFQLNNIPMFHGAYLITHVKHSIKPNNMLTHFTGVRVRAAETGLLTAADLYMNLLQSIDVSKSSDGSSTSSSNAINDPTFNRTIIPDSSLKDNGFVNPFYNNYPITSAPGVRNRNGNLRNHEGLDIGIPVNQPLLAIYDGFVELIKYNYNPNNGLGYGLYMVINHGVINDNGLVYKTVYGHLSNISEAIIGKGAKVTGLTGTELVKYFDGFNPNISVTKGQEIGRSGGEKTNQQFIDDAKHYNLAGGSSGAHLHFELRIDDASKLSYNFKSLQYVNPVPYLPLGQLPQNQVYKPDSSTIKDPDTIDRIPTPPLATRSKLFDDLKI